MWHCPLVLCREHSLRYEDPGALLPVCLGGQREHGLGGTAPGHEAAPAEVRGPASAAFSDQLLDGERLDDGGRAQGALWL